MVYGNKDEGRDKHTKQIELTSNRQKSFRLVKVLTRVVDQSTNSGQW